MTTTTAPKATLWSTFTGLFGAATELLDATTTIAASANDMAKALKHQTSIIEATSANDAEVKFATLEARIAAHKLSLLPPTAKSTKA